MFLVLIVRENVHMPKLPKFPTFSTLSPLFNLQPFTVPTVNIQIQQPVHMLLIDRRAKPHSRPKLLIVLNKLTADQQNYELYFWKGF